MPVSRKARSEQYVQVLHALLDDVSLVNGNKNTFLDKRTVLERFSSEGFSFLSKTLPKLGKALDVALRTGKFLCPTNFARYKNTALPCFLRGLLLRIFDNSGNLHSNVDIAAVCEMRQICFAFYKYIRPFTPRQERDAEEKFLSIDNSLPTTMPSDHPIVSEVLFFANRFLVDLLEDFDPYDIIPGHGPGIVASGEKPHEKYIFSTKYKELHEQYPYYRYFYINPSHLLHSVNDYRNRYCKDTGVNRVLFVPKDSRGPRTIACEPLEYQFIQQGILRKLVPYIEEHRLTRGRVNFTDQGINRNLARLGSMGENFVTLDLQDASDSVSLALVKVLFEGSKLYKPLLATRTPHSLLPSGNVVELKKFAAMGSALCFPVESLVFYSLLMGCYTLARSLYPVGFVYGDDIIIPAEISEFYIQILTAVGLKVNVDKSCLTGLFRESCGGDFFHGKDVTYAKIKTLDTKEPSALASVVALANEMFARGFYKCASLLDKMVPMKLPEGFKTSPYLCLYNDRSYPSQYSPRWCEKTHVFVRRLTAVRGIDYDFSDHNPYRPYMRKHLQGWGESFVDGRFSKRGAKYSRQLYPIGT